MGIGIDPRVFSALLRLQMASPLYSDSAAGTGSDSLFGTLFGGLLAGSGAPAAASSLYGSGPFGRPSATQAGHLDSVSLQAGTLYSANLLPLLIGLRNAYAVNEVNGGGSETLYDALIRRSAERYGVDPALVKAVVRTESAFNPYAVSRAGAKGLMQLMDATARSLGVVNPFDPVQNVTGGTRYLAWLLGKYGGNVKAALAAYNAGPGRVDRLGILTDEAFDEKRSLLPEETQVYVDRVLEAFERYRAAAP